MAEAELVAVAGIAAYFELVIDIEPEAEFVPVVEIGADRSVTEADRLVPEAECSHWAALCFAEENIRRVVADLR